jgi:tRNA threonylcarbamoyladenosine biosynthesis protein TsaE
VISVTTRSADGTAALAAAIASLSRPGDVIVLTGPMGAGKTAFVRGFAAAAGVGAHEDVTSPTFTLVHEYVSGRMPVHHADLYRLGSTGEVADLGLRERADMGAVVLVEWGEAAGEMLGDHLAVELEPDEEEDDVRHVVVTVDGHGWDTRWDRLRSAVEGAAL